MYVCMRVCMYLAASEPGSCSGMHACMYVCALYVHSSYLTAFRVLSRACIAYPTLEKYKPNNCVPLLGNPWLYTYPPTNVIITLTMSYTRPVHQIAWTLGPGSCTETCATKGFVCSESELAALTSRQAAEDAFEAAGITCNGWNSFDYGQGLSQCTNAGCCGGRCVGHCSVPKTQVDVLHRCLLFRTT